MKIRAHIFVSGSVQGVFFRSKTQQIAEASGVVGWVRNLPDGSVEAVFEGEEEGVKALLEFCRHGPRGAVVTNIELTKENYTGKFQEFEIGY